MEINLTKVSLIEVNLPTVVVVQTTCMSDGSDLARKSLAQIGMIGAEVILIGDLAFVVECVFSRFGLAKRFLEGWFRAS